MRSVDVFAQLSEQELTRIAALLKEKLVNKDTVIFRQGDAGDALYFLLSGLIKGSQVDSTGRKKEMGFLSEGQFFGEMALLTGEPYSATMWAEADARLLVLHKGDFDDYLARNVQVMVHTMKMVAQRQAANTPRGAERGAEQRPRWSAEQRAEQSTEQRPQRNTEQWVEASTEQHPERSAEQRPEPGAEQRPEPGAEDTPPSGKVFTVFSPKGGVGKTTVAVNLAVALARAHPGSVALLDLSLTFSHTTLLLNLTPRSTLSATTAGSLRGMGLEEMSYYLSVHPSSSLRVLAGAMRPEEGEMVTGEMARVAIEQLRRHFAYVVIDTESYFSDPVLGALEASDRILLLCSPEITALRDVRECQRILDQVVHVPRNRVLYLMNYLFPFKALSKEQFQEALRQELFSELPYSAESPVKAALRGEALVETQSGSPLARSLQRLATVLVSDMAGLDPHQDKRRGFFR